MGNTCRRARPDESRKFGAPSHRVTVAMGADGVLACRTVNSGGRQQGVGRDGWSGVQVGAETDDVVAARGLSEAPNLRRSSQLTLFTEDQRRNKMDIRWKSARVFIAL